MRTPRTLRPAGCAALIAFAMLIHSGPLSAAPLSDEELFDLRAILNDPLDAKVLETTKSDGIVTEKFEITSRVVDGKPERIEGLFAYPEGAKALPAVFWSMGGMAPANPFFPEIFARKGYACMAVTLPHPIRNSRDRFDTANPKAGNFTLLARDQMRGVTYLSGRPEVDPDQIAVGGASYGGVFATMLAGIDPRLKAGMSFFGGGHHAMGTSLPQFTKLRSAAEVEIWNQTVDPAYRHQKRSIPFLWAVAFNDNWFFFPAVIETYKNAVSPEKRLVIMPWWQHGFSENIDRAITDFPETVMTRRRAPYNNPGPLQLRTEGGKPVFHFEWTGDNPVKTAELIVSYGEYTLWLGWLHRACFVFPAAMDGRSASAVLPIPSQSLPLIAWANITDEKGVVTSTLPVVLEAKDLAPFAADPALKLNAFVDGDFGPDVIEFYKKSGYLANASGDPAVKQAGAQSLRIDPSDDPKIGRAVKISLFHSVPGLAHRFSLWVRAAEPEEIAVTLTPVRPRHWDSPVVSEIVAKDPRLALLLPQWKKKPAPLRAAVQAGPEWKEITIDLPLNGEPVEGYTFAVEGDPEKKTPFWIDSLRMEPVWPASP